jgi:hypothetical protein
MCGHEHVCLYEASVQQQECGKKIMFCSQANILQVKMLWYLTECGEPYSILLTPLALILEGTHIASHYLLKAWARPQLANLTEYAVCEWHVKAHWLSMLVQKNWQILMDYKTGEHAISPKAHQEWIGPYVVRMEACSIKSKQLGLLSWPALLKFEVYHGSMSECM